MTFFKSYDLNHTYKFLKNIDLMAFYINFLDFYDKNH